MKWTKPAIGFIMLMMVVLSGCTPMKKINQESVKALLQQNTLPENGIVTANQWKTIEGKTGTYTFQGKSGTLDYVWSFDGEQIHNPIEQNLAVTFTEEGLSQVKKEANHATVGLAFSVEKQELIAPASITFTLNEKWDANTAILCQRINNQVSKISDVTMGKVKKGKHTVTSLTVPLTQVDATYYIVGGKVQTKEEKESIKESAEKSQTCTLAITCKRLLKKKNELKKTKQSFVPADGIILRTTKVAINKGDTIYDVLQRTCRNKGIHMEASYTPGYGSYYVEGINQLYEFDCGELSGWSFYVNGWSPNYGSSEYKVKAGDTIEWFYTCDLGKDRN